MTVAEWQAHATALLEQVAQDSARTEAAALIRIATGWDRAELHLRQDDPLDPAVVDPLLERRVRGEPIAYMRGHQEFYGRTFRVAPSVLIPRPDTETLIELVLDHSPSGTPTVLDVGTGSGCIAVTLKCERPAWIVTAVDISAEAITVAEHNAAMHHADIVFIEADLWPQPTALWDVIVSNPPYVAGHDELGAGVREFEPHLALFADEDGYAFYHRLATEGRKRVSPQGMIAVEVGAGQSARVSQIFAEEGWLELETRCDLTGTPRAIAFRGP
jgi:release factor glutamine methyltransferase